MAHHPFSTIIRLFFPLLLLSCEQQQGDIQRAFHRDMVEEGDLLLRLGCSPESQAVIAADSGVLYSHIGLAIEVGGVVMAAHAVPGEGEPEYVKYEPLADFFHPVRALRGAIARFPLTEAQQTRLSERAMELIDQRILFDHQYDDSDARRLYCTEFIWCVYAALGMDVSAGQRRALRLMWLDARVILPSHILQHPRLKLIHEF